MKKILIGLSMLSFCTCLSANNLSNEQNNSYQVAAMWLKSAQAANAHKHHNNPGAPLKRKPAAPAHQ